MTIEQI